MEARIYPRPINQANEKQEPQEPPRRNRLYIFKGCAIFVILSTIVLVAFLPNVIKSMTQGVDSRPNPVTPTPTAKPNSTYGLPANDTRIVKDSRYIRSFWGIDYTPLGTQMVDGCGATQRDVVEDLKILYQLTPRIRLYGMDCNQTALVLNGLRLLKVDMGVLLTLWVDGNQTTFERQYQTFVNVLKQYGGDHILGVSVGNEAIFRREITSDGLIDLIKQVKTNLSKMGYPHIPVYTTEIRELEKLIPHEDAVLDNVHPFFAGTRAQDAANWTYQYFYDVDQYPTIKMAQKQNMKPTANNPYPQVKPALISEIGWPTEPKSRHIQAAVPSIENQQILLNTFVCEANRRGLPYFWFEFQDQPWKSVVFNETRESFWGLFDKNRTLKPSIKIPNCPLHPWKKGDLSIPQPKPLGTDSEDA